MVLPAITATLGGIGTALGALGIGNRQGVKTTTTGTLPAWQEKALRDEIAKQRGLTDRPLAQQTQAGLGQFRSSGAIDDLARLAGRDSYLGQTARGDYIGSDAYKRTLEQMQAPVIERFEEVELPRILQQYSAGGRLGSPSMMRATDRAQRNLAQGLGKASVDLLNAERTRQAQAVGSLSSLLGNIEDARAQRAGRLLETDPTAISAQRRNRLQKLLGQNFGKTSSTPYSYNPYSQLGGSLMKFTGDVFNKDQIGTSFNQLGGLLGFGGKK